MRRAFGSALALALCVSLASNGANAVETHHPIRLATPHLVFRGTEPYEANGFDFVRYHYDVTNKAKYPKALFAQSAGLPACGDNPNPTRVAIAIFDTAGKSLIEFCSLPGPEQLDRLWFAVPAGTSPPDGVYIEITDRLTGKRTRSNLASTSAGGVQH